MKVDQHEFPGGRNDRPPWNYGETVRTNHQNSNKPTSQGVVEEAIGTAVDTGVEVLHTILGR
jgi:hypothetical protein